MSFNPDDTRLTEYVLGELQGAERDQFEAELARNDALRQAVDALRETVEAVAEGLRAEPLEGLMPQQRTALQTAIAGAKAEQPLSEAVDAGTAPDSQRPRLRRAFAAMGLAASLLAACGLGYQFGRGQAMQLADARHGPVPQTATSSDLHANRSKNDSVVSKARNSGELGAALSTQNGAVSSPVAASPDNPLPSEELPRAIRRRKPADAPPTASDTTSYYFGEQLGDVNGRFARGGRQRLQTLSQGRALQETDEGGLYAPHSDAERIGNGIGGGIMGGERSHTKRALDSRGGMMGGVMMGGDMYGEGMMPGGFGGSRLDSLESLSEVRGRGGVRTSLGKKTLLQLFTRDAEVPGEGVGPEFRGDQYLPIVENPFREAINVPLSTFSIDVDTASYAKTRMYLLEQNSLPRPDAVRVEEMLNYFVYDYAPPEDERPFAAHVETATCPWAPQHRLVRVALKGREIARDQRPTSNLVFLLDVSGSMRPENKLPLVKRGMKQLVDQLGENDRVAIVVYAGAAGLVLEPTPGSEKQRIIAALDQLQAGGSTNGGQGIHLAYKTARENFFEEGVNRVILCTDGDFNVGTTGTDQLVELAQDNAKTGVFLSVLGFGMGNHNDAMLEQISNQGNGNYAFIDTPAEARKVLVEQLSGTLVTIAKDVKIQVEMNPARVAAYRLIGYENRVLAAEDFNDDKKDAGEIGAGHSVTALYEIVPVGEQLAEPPAEVDELKYQVPARLSEAAESDELLTLKLRYKQPDGDTSQLIRFPVRDEGSEFEKASRDFQFASAVASFGMLLRDSKYRGNATYDAVLEIATAAAGEDPTGYRRELLEMVRRAKELTPVPPAVTDEPMSEE